MNAEELDKELPDVPEPTITFKLVSDRDVYKVVSEDNPDLTLIEMTGYDLQFNFNMPYLKSLKDINAASEAIGVMFKDIILERIFPNKQTEE